MPHTKITTGKHGKTPRGAYNIDASTLPNPYEEKWLRPRDGRDKHVQSWIFNQPGVTDILNQHLTAIIAREPATISVTCSAGRHRSVAVGEWLTQQLQDAGWSVRLEHLNVKTKASTTERGYGRSHQKARERLMYNHRDGSPCWWCGLPMYRDKTRNWDGQALAADHSTTNGARDGQHADRLLHGRCNSQAQGHTKDHLRPALTGRHPSEPLGGGQASKPAPTRPPFVWA